MQSQAQITNGLGEVDELLARLTRRERIVLGLLAQGRTNLEIGRALGCTILTATNHVDHVLAKLEIRDRAEAQLVRIKQYARSDRRRVQRL